MVLDTCQVQNLLLLHRTLKVNLFDPDEDLFLDMKDTFLELIAEKADGLVWITPSESYSTWSYIIEIPLRFLLLYIKDSWLGISNVMQQYSIFYKIIL